ncbi:MAG: hypothetical protein JSR19_07830 [Proteobacteria bacterium]|nr:hypothetical protein [Pseudomonadota bacterium]
MTLPPFPDIKEQSDYELGGLLLGYFIAAQADDLGIPRDQIPDEFAERVRAHVLTLETATAKNAAVEKALHKAAGGDFEAAGKLLREHMIAGAVALKFVPIGVKFSQGRKPGTGGPIRKAIAKLLAKNPAMKNPDLWEAIKKKPPKRWSAEEHPYYGFEPELRGPNRETDHMSYRRFCTVCGEERKKVKGKITS